VNFVNVVGASSWYFISSPSYPIPSKETNTIMRRYKEKLRAENMQKVTTGTNPLCLPEKYFQPRKYECSIYM
jgi:hypothetical protein